MTHPMNAPTDKGFTLLELMVTMSIVMLLILIAAPSFLDLTQRNRVATETNNLVGTLSLARSEAVTQGVSTSVCPIASPESTSCDGNNWSDWKAVYLDFDNDNVMDAGERIVKVFEPVRNTVINSNNANLFMGFTALGRSRNAQTLFLCAEQGSAFHARRLVISPTGRISVFEDGVSNDDCNV